MATSSTDTLKKLNEELRFSEIKILDDCDAFTEAASQRGVVAKSAMEVIVESAEEVVQGMRHILDTVNAEDKKRVRQIASLQESLRQSIANHSRIEDTIRKRERVNFEQYIGQPDPTGADQRTDAEEDDGNSGNPRKTFLEYLVTKRTEQFPGCYRTEPLSGKPESKRNTVHNENSGKRPTGLRWQTDSSTSLSSSPSPSGSESYETSSSSGLFGTKTSLRNSGMRMDSDALEEYELIEVTSSESFAQDVSVQDVADLLSTDAGKCKRPLRRSAHATQSYQIALIKMPKIAAGPYITWSERSDSEILDMLQKADRAHESSDAMAGYIEGHIMDPEEDFGGWRSIESFMGVVGYINKWCLYCLEPMRRCRCVCYRGHSRDVCTKHNHKREIWCGFFADRKTCEMFYAVQYDASSTGREYKKGQWDHFRDCLRNYISSEKMCKVMVDFQAYNAWAKTEWRSENKWKKPRCPICRFRTLGGNTAHTICHSCRSTGKLKNRWNEYLEIAKPHVTRITKLRRDLKAKRRRKRRKVSGNPTPASGPPGTNGSSGNTAGASKPEAPQIDGLMPIFTF